jgi:signal transduction histidine kinase
MATCYAYQRAVAIPCIGVLAESVFRLSRMFTNHRTLTRLSPRTAERRSDIKVVGDERRKISRDIHDSAIQPYIGLKFALEALARKASPDHVLFHDIKRLIEMTEIEIEELRRYVNGLRRDRRFEYVSLENLLRFQASRLGELYGLEVSVEVSGELEVDEGLADEASHIVGEALSNIRRHTSASAAAIRLSRDTHKLQLEIENECDAGWDQLTFMPESIAERARALGGSCHVKRATGRNTVVVVELPENK